MAGAILTQEYTKHEYFIKVVIGDQKAPKFHSYRETSPSTCPTPRTDPNGSLLRQITSTSGFGRPPKLQQRESQTAFDNMRILLSQNLDDLYFSFS